MADAKEQKEEKEHMFVLSMRYSANQKDRKARAKNNFLLIGQKEKESIIPSFKTKKGQKGKGHTAEEASIPESDAQDQWLEPGDTSTLHDSWQTDSSIWDWYPENDWEDAEANYQDWATSQDWQSSTSWFVT